MPQVLVYTNRIELKTLIEIKGSSVDELAVAVYYDEDEFKNFINMFSEVELIVVDDPEPELLKFVLQYSHKFKNLFVVTSYPVVFERAKIFKPHETEKILESFNVLFKTSEQLEHQYISIPLGSLVHFTSLPVDIYTKIEDKEFLKCINANDEIQVETMMRLEQEGVDFIYFEKKNKRELTAMLLNNMIKKVEKVYVSLDEKLKANNEVYHTTREIVSKMGLPPKIIDVAESVVGRITDESKKESKAISSYLNELRTNTDLGFRYRFAEISSFLATKIAQEMPDSTNDYVKKVVYACLFCDVALTDRSFIHVRSNEELIKLTAAQQKEINQHAFVASELIGKSRHAPIEVDKLIKQHHGSMTGHGFYKELSIKLSPFSLCVITAQEVAYSILMTPDKSMGDIVLDGKKVFSSSLIDRYFEFLEKDLTF